MGVEFMRNKNPNRKRSCFDRKVFYKNKMETPHPFNGLNKPISNNVKSLGSWPGVCVTQLPSARVSALIEIFKRSGKLDS